MNLQISEINEIQIINLKLKTMSGSGGGGYVPPQKTKFNCLTAQIRTNVSSIDLNVLTNHQVGDILDAEISNNSLILINGNGEVLGSIIHPNTVDLIECIDGGNEYEAEISVIQYPLCTVIIRRK